MPKCNTYLNECHLSVSIITIKDVLLMLELVVKQLLLDLWHAGASNKQVDEHAS